MKKITLKNLHEATAQEVFDQVAIHLLTQKERCVGGPLGACRYKEGEMKCAAGCLISEDEYDVHIEGYSFKGVLEFKGINLVHVNLIADLQIIHDLERISKWKEELIYLSKKYNLNTNAIENLN